LKLPVTVKTRLGWNEATKNIMEVAERLQDVGISALSIHGRTRAQLYKGPADWTLIGAVKNNPRITIPIFGNGDIDGPEKAMEYRERYGVDGIMIGRASIGHPWIFNEIKHFMATGETPRTHPPSRSVWRPPANTYAARWRGRGRGKVWWRCGATTGITSRAYPT
jgi:tRNA-dihydrouridine synthase B